MWAWNWWIRMGEPPACLFVVFSVLPRPTCFYVGPFRVKREDKSQYQNHLCSKGFSLSPTLKKNLSSYTSLQNSKSFVFSQSDHTPMASKFYQHLRWDRMPPVALSRLLNIWQWFALIYREASLFIRRLLPFVIYSSQNPPTPSV